VVVAGRGGCGKAGLTVWGSFEIAGATSRSGLPTTGRGGTNVRGGKNPVEGANKAGQPADAGTERPEPVS
jgi:hypothetical protein